MVYGKPSPKLISSSDDSNVSVFHSEEKGFKYMFYVRFISGSVSKEIEVTKTSHASCFMEWIREAANQRMFSFSVKPQQQSHFLTLAYDSKCLIFRFSDGLIPPVLSDFLLDQSITFYGGNMTRDHVKESLRDVYGLELLGNVNFLSKKEIESHYRDEKDAEIGTSANYIKRWISLLQQKQAKTNKWRNLEIPEEYISFMSLECKFVYDLLM